MEINLNKEILAAKMHIHDELGHCLLATTKAITEDRLAENADTLRKSWNSTIQDFSNISDVYKRQIVNHFINNGSKAVAVFGAAFRAEHKNQRHGKNDRQQYAANGKSDYKTLF